jgi:hypothetical protein
LEDRTLSERPTLASLQTANDAAGVMIVAKGWPTTAISGANFTISMANGTAAAATENFFWRVVQ